MYWREAKYEFHKPGQTHLEALNRLDPKPGEKVLDLACGSGPYCLPIVKTGATYIGLDVSKPSVYSLYQTELKSMNNSNWAVLVGDAESIPLRNNSVDKVFCVGSFSCFPNQAKAIGEVYRALKQDGLFAVNIVNALDWRWFRARLEYRLIALAKTLGRRFTPLQHLFTQILKRDVRKVGLYPTYPKFTFLIERFISSNGFRTVNLHYSLRNRKGPNYSKEKVNLFRRVFCEGVILILQKQA